MDIIEVTQEVTVFEAVTPGQDDEISDTVEEVMPEDEANEPEDDLFWDVTGLEDEELDGEMEPEGAGRGALPPHRQRRDGAAGAGRRRGRQMDVAAGRFRDAEDGREHGRAP